MKKIRVLLSYVFILTIIVQSFINTNVYANSLVVLSESVESQIVTDGLIYEKKSKLTNLGWVDIYVLKMDLNNSNVDLDIIRSIREWSSKQSLTTLMQENSSIAGINASFFDMASNPTDSIGVEYEKDYNYLKENYNKTSLGAASMMVTPNNQIDFGYISGNITFKSESGVGVYISSINGMTDFINSNVFNTNAMSNTSSIESKGNLHKIVVEDGYVIRLGKPKEVVTIPTNGYIVTINDSIADKIIPRFSVGTKVELNITTNYGSKLESYDTILSGGGTILKNGAIINEGMIVDANRRHPRTAVGVTRNQDYLISMVVDGRGVSIGATHNELANYLLEYGVFNAIHMDGGGSSTIASRTFATENIQVNNKPSDGSQRKVVNGLGFVSTAPQGELYGLEISSNNFRVFPGNPVTFSVRGYDQYYNPFKIDTSFLEFTVDGVSGVWQNNTFTPTSSGEATITVRHGSVTKSTKIYVMSDVVDIEISPKILFIQPNNSHTYNLIGTDNKGFKGKINPEYASFKIDNEELGYFANGTFVASSKTGVGNISISIGNTIAKGHVVVGNVLEDNTILNRFHVNIPANDLMRYNTNTSYSYKMSLIGQTKNKNRLLDTIVQNKMIEILNKSDVAIFAGNTDINKSDVKTSNVIWDNTYRNYVFEDVKVITLGTENGGLRGTDFRQWQKLQTDLVNTSQQNIIIIGNRNPVIKGSFSDEREAKLLHETLKNFQNVSTKNIYYINASGNGFKVDYFEGIRYIDINGLNYNVNNNKVDLTSTFYVLNFYLVNGELKYDYERVYPLIQID